MFKEKIFKFFKKADNDNTEKIDTSYTTDTDNIKDNIAYNTRFDTSVTSVLKKAGWYEGRKTDISKLVEILEEAGFEVFEKAREFMTEFDGLTIPRIYAKDYSNGTRATDFYHFDVQKVTAWIFKNCTPENRKKVAGTVGKHMCFREKVFQIGELGQSDVPLYVTRDGKIVSDRLLYGNTIEEGMQNLLSDKHLGLIPALPPEDPEKARLQQERFKDYNKHYLTNLSLDKENGIVSWLYESDTIKTERLKNCTWCNFYSKLFVMITTKENNTKKNTLYDAYANFVLAYNIEENKIFTSKTDFYIVDNLQFVAYNRHLNRLIVLTGDTSDNHCLYIYDLNGNITAQIQPPDGMVISSAKIDYIDYNILISCKAVADINTSDNAKESVYNIDYDNDTLVKNILFD